MALERTELERIAASLRAALAILEKELAPIDVPDDVADEVRFKLAQRICLAWDHRIPDNEAPKRGLCVTCYGTTMARIRKGLESERSLILQGKLTAKPNRGGRPSRRETVSPEEVQKVAEDVAAYKRSRKGKSSGGS